jgi:ribose 5-phosphate isomerase B
MLLISLCGKTIMEDNGAPIILGSDHAAFGLKEYLKELIIQKGIEVRDVGAHSTKAADYPDFGFQVAEAVSSGKYSHGILLCGTGLGMSMVANKFPHVRAALCNDLFSAIMSRRHNNANILVMGGRVIGDVLAREIVIAWLETPFEGGRHQRRLDKFENMGCLVPVNKNNGCQ